MLAQSGSVVPGRKTRRFGAVVGIVLGIGIVGVVPGEERVEASGPELQVVAAVDAAESGETWFRTLCSTCHTVFPPPNLAPPMVMVVGHYLEEHGTRDAAAAAIARWVRTPDPAHSAMPEHAIERFGIMPPQPLPEEDAAAVADYVLELYESEELAAEVAASLPVPSAADESARGEPMMTCQGMQGGAGSDEAPGMQGERGMHRHHGMHRGGNMPGGEMRGGEMRGGDMRGGDMRGGDMRAGGMRAGTMRGGTMRGGMHTCRRGGGGSGAR